MVSFDDLRKISAFADMDETHLGRLLPFTQLQIFGDRAVIYSEGQRAEYFYMLLKGKVLLEVEVSEAINISLGSIKPGYSFGWSALLPGSKHTSFAVCVEPCEVITMPGEKLLEVMEQDHVLGHRFMEFMATVLKHRLERRTNQFLKTLKTHPEIEKLISE
ncbi:MAG: Crp/Fnr family transcriptional regulator [Deltaproteobacteria bacterium]|nr:Crp/Fnr family transcriptional regulator [Deltaproteobacteria bacterium]MBW1923048.1 Crp/Fnr family transcriptional regulator [Deltaproteobacteria bacterium]MBW1949081.1 Crp/Fnr family transcriptional regulator [Deltaproteobacteria bacterium]MBW2008245.1 Crp/Fnr family transcriptional regulator [Deltaproteobacteria bacterium]MBW2102243.1 Crp/Fnr family transcriptional regulator [Deltaproteobacteria bacterium]